MLDALCHAIESLWSVNSTEESKKYSRGAICQVLRHMDGYLANTKEGNAGMLQAANIAGKAINITQTTAGHAMCYKLTSLFGCAHGHATALCVRKLFPWMVNHTEDCFDPRGDQYLKMVLEDNGNSVGCKNACEAAGKLEMLFCALELPVPTPTTKQYEILKTSVNPARLTNHPISLDEKSIDLLYHRILR